MSIHESVYTLDTDHDVFNILSIHLWPPLMFSIILSEIKLNSSLTSLPHLQHLFSFIHFITFSYKNS